MCLAGRWSSYGLGSSRPAGLPVTGSASASQRLSKRRSLRTPRNRRTDCLPQSAASKLSSAPRHQAASGYAMTSTLLRTFAIASCLALCLTGCFGKLIERASPTPTQTAPEAPELKCNDRALLECPGVDPRDIRAVAERIKLEYPEVIVLDNAAEAIALGSLALEALDTCRLQHHAELVRCVTEYKERAK